MFQFNLTFLQISLDVCGQFMRKDSYDHPTTTSRSIVDLTPLGRRGLAVWDGAAFWFSHGAPPFYATRIHEECEGAVSNPVALANFIGITPWLVSSTFSLDRCDS
jgi:hypothetical protein